jgi:hypothetical protein
MDTRSKTSRLHPKIKKMHPLKKTMELRNQSMWTQLQLRPMSVWCTPFVSVRSHSSRPRASTVHIERKHTCNILQLSEELCIPNLSTLISHFLLEQSTITSCDNPDDPNYPRYDGKISVFNSASALSYAPSDVSGIHGMRREFIRSTPLWRNEAPRYDCAFVNVNPVTEPMKGLEVVRILAFFSFYFKGVHYPCAVVHWFDRVGDQPDEDTGMWLVCPQVNQQHQRSISVIHIDSIYWAAYLIPVYGKHCVPPQLRPHYSYDNFRLFYVNKFVDHHAFEIFS